MEIDEIEFQIARLQLGPDDILVIRSPKALSMEEARRLYERVRSIIGNQRKVMVLETGVDLSVLTVAELEAHIAAAASC